MNPFNTLTITRGPVTKKKPRSKNKVVAPRYTQTPEERAAKRQTEASAYVMAEILRKQRGVSRGMIEWDAQHLSVRVRNSVVRSLRAGFHQGWGTAAEILLMLSQNCHLDLAHVCYNNLAMPKGAMSPELVERLVELSHADMSVSLLTLSGEGTYVETRRQSVREYHERNLRLLGKLPPMPKSSHGYAYASNELYYANDQYMAMAGALLGELRSEASKARAEQVALAVEQGMRIRFTFEPGTIVQAEVLGVQP